MLRIVLPPLSEEEALARLADMDRLGRRDYAEIGVPMFLATEDLTGNAPSRPSDGTLDGTGRILATLLAEGVEALRTCTPDLTADDLARLIEALADRHLLALAVPAFSRAPDLHPAEAA
ncbi:hypothetical protein [Rubellimicrobium aerolatum]|uniref:Uncharacterized protein n=1 Tax=Rubellimicrobium aerolatum TaxID=490979 RepID=A0ABW0SFE1_9RHOB|nr:hypothetical protein [Rubellimicrobium aerolatum]MBP1807068.1 hypothetical protein [Rubellimicrobium aerolatum]